MERTLTPPLLDLAELESALVNAVVQHSPDVRDLLERFVDRLLTDCAGIARLDTDGLVVSSEMQSKEGYVAAGHVWTLPGHVTEPLLIRLAGIESHGAIAAGEVYFGLATDRPTTPSFSHSKALKLLIGDPDRAVPMLPWTHRFRRDATGWVMTK